MRTAIMSNSAVLRAEPQSVSPLPVGTLPDVIEKRWSLPEPRPPRRWPLRRFLREFFNERSRIWPSHLRSGAIRCHGHYNSSGLLGAWFGNVRKRSVRGLSVFASSHIPKVLSENAGPRTFRRIAYFGAARAVVHGACTPKRASEKINGQI